MIQRCEDDCFVWHWSLLQQISQSFMLPKALPNLNKVSSIVTKWFEDILQRVEISTIHLLRKESQFWIRNCEGTMLSKFHPTKRLWRPVDCNTVLTSCGISVNVSMPRRELKLSSIGWRWRAAGLWNMKIMGIPTRFAINMAITTLITPNFNQNCAISVVELKTWAHFEALLSQNTDFVAT